MVLHLYMRGSAITEQPKWILVEEPLVAVGGDSGGEEQLLRVTERCGERLNGALGAGGERLGQTLLLIY